MKVDYIALSIPIFFLLIGIELAYTYFHKLKYYRLNDSISNLSQGIGQQVTGIFMKTAVFFGYKYIYEHLRIFDLPSTILNTIYPSHYVNLGFKAGSPGFFTYRWHFLALTLSCS